MTPHTDDNIPEEHTKFVNQLLPAIRKIISKEELIPVAIAKFSEGTIALPVDLSVYFKTRESKQHVMKVINYMLGMPDVWMVALVSEAWTATVVDQKELDKGIPVKDMPGARECASIIVYDTAGNCTSHSYLITEDRQGLEYHGSMSQAHSSGTLIRKDSKQN